MRSEGWLGGMTAVVTGGGPPSLPTNLLFAGFSMPAGFARLQVSGAESRLEAMRHPTPCSGVGLVGAPSDLPRVLATIPVQLGQVAAATSIQSTQAWAILSADGAQR